MPRTSSAESIRAASARRRGLHQDVADHLADHPAHGLQPHQPRLQSREVLAHRGQHRPDQRHLGKLVQGEDPRRQPVVDIVIVVGDVVGDGRDLRLRRRPGPEPQIELAVELHDRLPRRRAQHPRRRAVVLDHALQRLPRQVEPIEGGIAPLQTGQDAEGLDVVVEAAPRRHPRLQHVLAGMAERRMTEIVAEADRLGEVGVQPQRPGERPRDLRHLEGMGQAGAEMIALVSDEDLGLLLQPPEGRGVDDPVAVAGEGGAGRARRFGGQPTARSGPVHGP